MANKIINENISIVRQDMVAHVCNLSYSGVRDQETKTGRIEVGGQPAQEVSKIPSQSISQAWCCAPVIPAMQEAIVRRIIV
jgi:hypothetical protein